MRLSRSRGSTVFISVPDGWGGVAVVADPNRGAGRSRGAYFPHPDSHMAIRAGTKSGASRGMLSPWPTKGSKC